MPIPWAAIPPLIARGFAAAAAADAIRDEFCQLYDQYPEFISGAIGYLPGGGFVNSLIPFVCPNSSPPSQPFEPPFNGGQCCGLYNVTVVGVLEGETVDTTFPAPGKIGGVFWRESEGSPVLYSGSWLLESGLDCPGVEPRLDFLWGGTNLSMMPSASIVSISRVDGLPDDCGNPNPTWPRVSPPPSGLNFDINVPVGNVNVTVPVSVNFNAPPINVSFSPTISFSTPIGDFIFSPEGWDILVPGRPPSDGDPNRPDDRDRLPDPRVPEDRPPLWRPPPFPGAPPIFLPPGSGNPPPNGCPDVNLSPVLTAIRFVQLTSDEILEGVNELLERDCCELPTPEECEKKTLGSGQGDKVAIGKDTVYVGIEINRKPENFKGYFNDGSPDVVFAGWHSFGSEECEGVRTPIQYEKNIYPKPSGCSSFSFGLQMGYTATCYEYLYVREEEENGGL